MIYKRSVNTFVTLTNRDPYLHEFLLNNAGKVMLTGVDAVGWVNETCPIRPDSFTVVMYDGVKLMDLDLRGWRSVNSFNTYDKYHKGEVNLLIMHPDFMSGFPEVVLSRFDVTGVLFVHPIEKTFITMSIDYAANKREAERIEVEARKAPVNVEQEYPAPGDIARKIIESIEDTHDDVIHVRESIEHAVDESISIWHRVVRAIRRFFRG